MKKTLLVTSIIGTLAFGACQNGQGGKGSSVNLFPEIKGKTVVAEFDNVKITDAYLESYLEQLNPFLKSRYNTPEKKKELFQKIIDGEILARKALKDTKIDDPVLLTKLKGTIARHYAIKNLKNEIEENVKVSEADIKKYFEENKKEYTQPEKVKASHILIKAEKKEDKKAALETAKKVLAEVKKGAKDPNSFGVLVKKYSQDDGSKRRNGDLGYFKKTEDGGRMVKEFSDAAFALKNVGDVSEIVESKFGFHIIKLTGKKEGVEKKLGDVKHRIESKLKADKRKDAYKNAIDNIKKSLNYKFYDDAVEKIDFKIPDNLKSKDGKDNPMMKPQIDKNVIQEMLKKRQQKPKALPQKGEKAPVKKTEKK